MMSLPSGSRLVWAASVERGARKVPLPCLPGRIVMASEALGQTTNVCRTAHSHALARSPFPPDVYLIRVYVHGRRYYAAPVRDERSYCIPPFQISLMCTFPPLLTSPMCALTQV